MKSIEKKLMLKVLSVSNSAKQLLSDKRGSSELIAIIAMAIIALVTICVIFWPNIKTWFSSVMTSFSSKTTALFDLT